MRDERGQATVEAALVIPVLFIGLLMLIQPGILLYDRLVMNAAAADTCRLLATKTDQLGSMGPSVEAYAKHRLSAVPPLSCFHLHEGECSWRVTCQGDESSSQVKVTIATKVKPLPLFDAAGAVLGLLDGDGCMTIEVSQGLQTRPLWANGLPAGNSPSGWIGAWAA